MPVLFLVAHASLQYMPGYIGTRLYQDDPRHTGVAEGPALSATSLRIGVAVHMHESRCKHTHRGQSFPVFRREDAALKFDNLSQGTLSLGIPAHVGQHEPRFNGDESMLVLRAWHSPTDLDDFVFELERLCGTPLIFESIRNPSGLEYRWVRNWIRDYSGNAFVPFT